MVAFNSTHNVENYDNILDKNTSKCYRTLIGFVFIDEVYRERSFLG